MNQTQINRIKSLFNWGELSRLLSGTRSVVLKDKYPKKHEPFINDLCDAVKPVLVKYGYEKADEPKGFRVGQKIRICGRVSSVIERIEDGKFYFMYNGKEVYETVDAIELI